MEHTYKTLKSPSEGFYKEKGSKFIAYVVFCKSENDAKNFLETWRKQHHGARHLCWAYRLGEDKSLVRSSDDGEPSNTAGMPILGQIRSFDLTNVLVGVVRYFGGTKLGVGGLITAYKEATYDALQKAQIVELKITRKFQITFNYQQMPQLMNFLKQNKFAYENQQFDQTCRMDVLVPIDKLELFEHEVKKLKVELKIKTNNS